ncbi:2-C-methyl-D-erythritol 4-phosphate cytidylyltransferase [Paracoccus litorisediminis]|uniref:IspD/TarI family cytidylyltransferase n=1 Tax=Paracoccus litorisediminis TaxID=2006130 RepID=UPI00372D9C7F
MSEKSISFLLLSGGVGTRVGHCEPKQFCEIRGMEMMAWSLRLADAHPRIGEIVTNAPEGFRERTRELCARHAPNTNIRIGPCGVTRQESVKILLSMTDCDIVVLHEAARPLIDREMLDLLIDDSSENAGYYAPVPFSLCEIDGATGMVGRNIPRHNVVNIQLPQKFPRLSLLRAHQLAAARGIAFTEDSLLLKEMLGVTIKPLPGPAKNIKVTTPEDIEIASVLLERNA